MVKEFVFTEQEIQHIRFIATHRPTSILINMTYAIFDYGDFHFIIECDGMDVKVNNNKYEVLFNKIYKSDKTLDHTNFEVIIRRPEIIKIFVVRTKLCFTETMVIRKTERFWHKIFTLFNKLNPFRSHSDKVTEEILADAVSYAETEQCNPELPVNSQDFTLEVIADVGLLIETPEHYVKLFQESNFFGFHTWEKMYLLKKEQLDEYLSEYTFLEISAE